MTDEVRERNDSAWLLTPNGAAPEHRLRDDMRRFDDAESVDLVIVGCGAGGSTWATGRWPGRLRGSRTQWPRARSSTWSGRTAPTR